MLLHMQLWSLSAFIVFTSVSEIWHMFSFSCSSRRIARYMMTLAQSIHPQSSSRKLLAPNTLSSIHLRKRILVHYLLNQILRLYIGFIWMSRLSFWVRTSECLVLLPSWLISNTSLETFLHMDFSSNSAPLMWHRQSFAWSLLSFRCCVCL